MLTNSFKIFVWSVRCPLLSDKQSRGHPLSLGDRARDLKVGTRCFVFGDFKKRTFSENMILIAKAREIVKCEKFALKLTVCEALKMGPTRISGTSEKINFNPIFM